MLCNYEYLVLVTGDEELVADFKRRARNNELALSLAQLKPPPHEALDSVDPLDIALFHLLLEGQPKAALELLEEMGETLPIRLEPEHLLPDIRDYQRKNPDALKAAYRVSRIIREHGAATAGNWKKHAWGDVTDFADAKLQEEADNRLVFQVRDNVRRRIALHELAMREVSLGVGIVEMDRVGQTQAQGFREPGEAFLDLKTERLDSESPVNYLIEKPDWFYLQAS